MESFLRYLQVNGLDDFNENEIDMDQNSAEDEEEEKLLEKGDEDPFEEILGNAKRRKKKGSLVNKVIPRLIGTVVMLVLVWVSLLYIIYEGHQNFLGKFTLYGYMDTACVYMT